MLGNRNGLVLSYSDRSPVFSSLASPDRKYAHMGIWAYAKKIWPSGVSPKRSSKMQLRDVDLRSVGPSVQKLWPTTFFAKKMPCILHGTAKKIRVTISRQVSGLAQLPDDLKFIVDQESNT